MATRKLGDIPMSVNGRSNKRSQYNGVKTIEPYGNSHQYTVLCEFLLGDDGKYQEQPQIERTRNRSIQPKKESEELELPQLDSVDCLCSVSNKCHRKQQVNVKDLLPACDVEVQRRIRQKCQLHDDLRWKPKRCRPGTDCVQCQVDHLKHDLMRCKHASDCKLYNICNAQRISMKDEEGSLDKAHVCRTPRRKNRTSEESVATPNPYLNPGWTILPDHWRVQSNSDTRTPDSEYDHGKMEELIKKFLPPASSKVSPCQRRGLNMVQYSEDVWRRGASYRPYRFRRGKVILDKCRKKTKTDARTTYSVSEIGLVYCLPGIPLDGGRAVPPQRTRKLNRTGILPPIRNVENHAPISRRKGAQQSVVFKQTRGQNSCS